MVGKMEFNKEQKQKADNIDHILEKFLPEEEGYQASIFSAMRYSIMAGGKRLRPMFMQETYHMFGGDNPQVIEPFMAAMEMIHTYSLVHDDLPAMDNDDYRRGRKTTHVVYGEAMGILAGDALLNYAFETACRSFDAPDAEFKSIAKALQVLSKKAGVYGMIGGQVVDVLETCSNVEHDKLNFIYRLKTSALIEASMMIGAILAGAKEEEIHLIESIASDVGLAFQIQDDVLDVTSTREVLGKPTHSDEKNDKTTYVTLFGVEEAKKMVEEISERAIKKLAFFQKEQSFLMELVKNLINREK